MVRLSGTLELVRLNKVGRNARCCELSTGQRVLGGVTASKAEMLGIKGVRRKYAVDRPPVPEDSSKGACKSAELTTTAAVEHCELSDVRACNRYSPASEGLFRAFAAVYIVQVTTTPCHNIILRSPYIHTFYRRSPF